MSLHTLAFVGLFLLFSYKTLHRSSWGVALYMVAFYCSPAQSSWGDVLVSTGIRWTLIAAVILATGVFLDRRTELTKVKESNRPILWLLFLYGLNATIVHFLFADNLERSSEGLVKLWKDVGLVYLLLIAIKDPDDLKVMIYSLVIGAGYVGYEVIFNDSGSNHDGRLWIRFGGMYGNLAVSFLCLSCTMFAYTFFYGNILKKTVSVVAAALALEVVLRVNSRGAFLGLLVGAVWLLVRSRGRQRLYSIIGICGGVAAIFAALDKEDQSKLFTRFSSIFVSAEKRDASAASRYDFWRAGAKMISDYPLGSGFEAAFESDRGNSYLADFPHGSFRSVHNGFLDIAASWGIQGLILYLAALFLAWRRLAAATSLAHSSGNSEASYLGTCVEAAVVIQLITSLFNSSLKSETFFWWIVLAVTCGHILPVLTSSHSQILSEDTPIRGEQADASFSH